MDAMGSFLLYLEKKKEDNTKISSTVFYQAMKIKC